VQRQDSILGFGSEDKAGMAVDPAATSTKPADAGFQESAAVDRVRLDAVSTACLERGNPLIFAVDKALVLSVCQAITVLV
jgi:hypothetical protein